MFSKPSLHPSKLEDVALCFGWRDLPRILSQQRSFIGKALHRLQAPNSILTDTVTLCPVFQTLLALCPGNDRLRLKGRVRSLAGKGPSTHRLPFRQRDVPVRPFQEVEQRLPPVVRVDPELRGFRRDLRLRDCRPLFPIYSSILPASKGGRNWSRIRRQRGRWHLLAQPS